MASSTLLQPAVHLAPAAAAPQPRLQDSFGRAITDLRVSVTDRCNYRCVYCRSGNEGALYDELPIADYLRIIRLFVSLGIEKVRLTGGEPLLRAGLLDLIQSLSSSPHPLRRAPRYRPHHQRPSPRRPRPAPQRRRPLPRHRLHGRRRSRTFTAITRVPRSFDRVLAGIRAASAAGLGPVKVNCVLLRGFNDTQIESVRTSSPAGKTSSSVSSSGCPWKKQPTEAPRA